MPKIVVNKSIVEVSEDGFRAAAHQHTLAAGPAPPLPPPPGQVGAAALAALPHWPVVAISDFSVMLGRPGGPVAYSMRAGETAIVAPEVFNALQAANAPVRFAVGTNVYPGGNLDWQGRPLPTPTPGVQEATNITAALQPRWQAANEAALLAADPTYTGVD
jgi:hypothetical protein